MQVVLRIRCDAETAQCPLGMKFGCDPIHEAPNLLHLAYTLNLNVVGFSFHVGSGCQDPPIYYSAIHHCKILFDMATNLGFKPYLLDLGGGYPGDKDTSIDKIAEIINKALDEFFNSKFLSLCYLCKYILFEIVQLIINFFFSFLFSWCCSRDCWTGPFLCRVCVHFGNEYS